MKRMTWRQWAALTIYMVIITGCLCLAMLADDPQDGTPQLTMCLIGLLQCGCSVVIGCFVTFVYIRLGIFRSIWENIDE